MAKPCFVFSTPFSRSSDRSRSATNSGPMKSIAGRRIACSTRCGMLVGPGCMKNCPPRVTLIACLPDRAVILPGGGAAQPAQCACLACKLGMRLWVEKPGPPTKAFGGDGSYRLLYCFLALADPRPHHHIAALAGRLHFDPEGLRRSGNDRDFPPPLLHGAAIRGAVGRTVIDDVHV